MRELKGLCEWVGGWVIKEGSWRMPRSDPLHQCSDVIKSNKGVRICIFLWANVGKESLYN